MIATPAQTFTTLFTFDYTDGLAPIAGLVQATNGDFYGTTYNGGANPNPTGYGGAGTVFKITPSGTLTTLYNFCAQTSVQANCTDGLNPYAGLVQATNGDFYGTTEFGGNANVLCFYGCGTVFKITPSGTLTTLYRFCSQDGCTDGLAPFAGLVQATNGDFYGTTGAGGANTAVCSGYGVLVGGCGTVFKITPSGNLTTLHSFDATDGLAPIAGLVQATNGEFYGTTSEGGANTAVCSGYYGGCGTVFKITPSGNLTTLHSFDVTDGVAPIAGLVQATNGEFYGTTSEGGANTAVCSGYGCGTVFKITPSGTLTTLHTFCSQGVPCADGYYPETGLLQATHGNFYGTTSEGGATGSGTVFNITPSGALTSFCCADGYGVSGLTQATNGEFLGTTAGGGANGDGTVFSLAVGLGSFVETQPSSGKVGVAVKILGTKLTGATSVTFNGTAAPFVVASASEITTTVPTGATTGTVKVVTPGGTLSSNVPFRVP
jgi:uncharacterized repeat protein (TIGR03803 family)